MIVKDTTLVGIYILNKLCYKVVRTNFKAKYGRFLFTPRFYMYVYFSLWPFGMLQQVKSVVPKYSCIRKQNRDQNNDHVVIIW